MKATTIEIVTTTPGSGVRDNDKKRYFKSITAGRAFMDKARGWGLRNGYTTDRSCYGNIVLENNKTNKVLIIIHY